MPSQSRPALSVLSLEDLEVFQRDGFVRVEQAFTPELALAMQDEIWKEMAQDDGIARDDPSTWGRPGHSPRRAKHLPLNEELAGAPVFYLELDFQRLFGYFLHGLLNGLVHATLQPSHRKCSRHFDYERLTVTADSLSLL